MITHSLSVCPLCKHPGRVLIVNGRMTSRRICDWCRNQLWDIRGDSEQALLPLDDDDNYRLQRRDQNKAG